MATPQQTAPTPRRTTRQLPRADRRAAIVAGATEVFARGGYAGTSMEDIAAASGITKLIVYRHFDSKEELYRSVLVEVFDRLREVFLEAYGSPGVESIGARSLLTVARENPDGFRLLWRHAAREPDFAQYADELRDRAVEASRVMLTGFVEPALHEWAAQTVMGFLVEAVLNWLEFGDAERDDEFVAFTTGALMRALDLGN